MSKRVSTEEHVTPEKEGGPSSSKKARRETPEGKQKKGSKGKSNKISAAKEPEVKATGTSSTGEKFTFFFRSGSPFSQWHSAEFTVDGIKYNCAEQYMMHQKAVLFGDEKTGQMILDSESPGKQKSLGRKVKPFDPVLWSSKAQDIVAKGSYHKFTQNADMLEKLLATQGTTLVEASPRDRLYGIGMGAKNPLALDRKTWKGRNLLGEILTKVRQQIVDEQK